MLRRNGIVGAVGGRFRSCGGDLGAVENDTQELWRLILRRYGMES